MSRIDEVEDAVARLSPEALAEQQREERIERGNDAAT